MQCLGKGPNKPYAGIVEGVVTLKLGDTIAYGIRGLKLIEHPHPLFLIGGDLLSGGRV